jgi:hypothetical protein
LVILPPREVHESRAHRPARLRRYSYTSPNTMSAATDWQRKLRLQAKGICTKCGKKPLQGKWNCASCAKRMRTVARPRMRKMLSCKPWVEGGHGRPPIDGASQDAN